MNILEPGERSNSVTTLLLNGGHAPAKLHDFCERQCGVVLGTGIGALAGKAVRIAHMGHCNAPMLLGTLSVAELALGALDIPHGRGGAQAAIDFLSESLAA